MINLTHVAGKDKGRVVLYALSTCIWCRKVKELLTSLGVDYYYTYVDKLEGVQKDEAVKEIEKWNPSCSFPTMVIDNKQCIIGFDEPKIREVLGGK